MGVASVVGGSVQTLAVQYELLRHRLRGGEQTTVYVVRYPRDRTSLRVQHFDVPQRLDRWCRRFGVLEAIAGGFFVRPDGPPLGNYGSGAAGSRRSRSS